MTYTTDEHKEAQPGSPEVDTQPPPQEPDGPAKEPSPASGALAWGILIILGLIGFMAAGYIAFGLAMSVGGVSIGLGLLPFFCLGIGPTLALPIAFHAARRGSKSGKAALVVSGLLLAAILLLLVSKGWLLLPWVIGWALLVGLMLLAVARFEKKPSPPTSDVVE